MAKDKKPAPKTPAKSAAAAKPSASSKDAAPAQAAAPAEPAAKAAAPKRPVFVPPPKPGGNFPGRDMHGKGGPKPPKGRIFRHQGR
jgi:hypothetical protein